VADIKPPDDSLSSYFDELLGAEELPQLQRDSVSAATTNTNNKVAKVVSLTKKSLAQKPISKTLENRFGQASSLNTRVYSAPETKVRSAPSQFPEVQNFAEPVVRQTPEQKQQLEKLLQTARTQLLVDSTQISLRIAQEIVAPSAPPVIAEPIALPEEIQEWDIESDYEAVSSLESDFPAGAVCEAEPVVASADALTYKLAGVEWLENGRPVWAQARFDVLLFKVSGLTLAVPLIALGQIRPITEELTPLFGQADWFMGFQLTTTGKISTVNTAKFVMPERYDENFINTAKYVVSINGVPWGLAVDSVNQPISLQPEDVKWRSDRSKRPWLAGTVKDHMCALLDIPQIGQILIDQDKNFQPKHS